MSKKKYVMVECVATYRLRYVVELNEDDPKEWACDTVVRGPEEELAQHFLGETIISHREVSKEDLKQLAVEDCSVYEDWSEEEVLERLVIRNDDSL